MERNRRRRQIDSRIDYGLILPVFLLCLVGLTSLYVALSHDSNVASISNSMIKQMSWILVGIVAIFITIHFSNKLIWKITPFTYFFGLILMILPRIFYSQAVYDSTGSYNWVVIGNTPLFQPSEFMKISYILLLSYIIAKHNAYFTHRIVKSDIWLIIKMGFVTLPVAATLAIQSDFGTFLVFIAIFLGTLLLTGISWRILIPLFSGLIMLGSLLIFLVTNTIGREILYKVGAKPYQFARIDSWLHPWENTSGAAYQQSKGLLAIGSGGLTGKGFNVSQVHIPVRESDMIFTVVGENFGFVGSAFVLLLYFILIYRMIRITFESNNEFYTYISTGIIMMILFHVFENVGANIGLLPLTGIPLPFISQGGSSMVGNMIGIGLILSMKYHQKPNFDDWKKYRELSSN